MSALADFHCKKLTRADRQLREEEVQELSPQVPDWFIVEEEEILHLERAFKFKNFVQALDFTNRIGELAEAEDHHPAILTEWGSVKVSWWTHAVRGLHRNDFIMAAKSDRIYAN